VPFAECHLQTHLQILLLRESQFLNRCLTCLNWNLLIIINKNPMRHGLVVIPLPTFIDNHTSSSLKNGDTGHLIETDETLSRPDTLSKHKPVSYIQTSAHPQSRNLASISPIVYAASQATSNGNANSWHRHHHDHHHPGAHPRLHTLGWLEYHLPDGTVYYVHPTSRVTTEINEKRENVERR